MLHQKKTLLPIIALLTLLSINTAHADKRGVYISGGFGWSSLYGMPSEEDLAIAGATQYEESNFSGRISVGYDFNILPCFGLGAELGWGRYADVDYGSVGTMDVSAYDLQLVGTYAPVLSRYSFSVKGGIAKEMMSVPDDLSGSIKGDRDEYNPIAGFGISYNITRAMQVHVDYSHIFGHDVTPNTDNSAAPSVDAVLIGLKRTFA